MQRFHHGLRCLLNFTNVSLLSVHDRDVYFRKSKKWKIHTLTKIDTSSRNKVDIKNHIFAFQYCNWREVGIRKCSFSFTTIFFFTFLFSCTCLMGKFKKTEYNPICKVFAEVFLIVRVPHCTVLITEAGAQRCSVKTGVLSNLAKFTVKHMCQSLFLNNFAGLRPEVISCEICKIFKNAFP